MDDIQRRLLDVVSSATSVATNLTETVRNDYTDYAAEIDAHEMIEHLASALIILADIRLEVDVASDALAIGQVKAACSRFIAGWA